jgi:streptogramin lyase
MKTKNRCCAWNSCISEIEGGNLMLKSQGSTFAGTLVSASTLIALVLAISTLFLLGTTQNAQAQCRTYTLDADFDDGLMINVNHDVVHDQLQLNDVTTPFPFIWIACSGKGTIVRIDVNTGQVLGEYLSSPAGRSRNPSRTTVDLHGNVWAGNRDEAGGGQGSVVKIGLVVGGTRGNKNPDNSFTPDPNGEYLQPPFDYSTAVDRDGDGYIKTSRGLGHVLSWPDITDGVGGLTALVEDADDECILIFQRVTGDNIRHVSVDANNNVWTAGNFGADNAFDLLDGNNGAILAGFDVEAGGYGGLVDGNNVIWSSNRGPGSFTTLRYDTKGTISIADDTWSTLPQSTNPYGLGIDGNGVVWNAQWTNNQVIKYASDGSWLGTFNTFGASNDRGVAVTLVDNHVWVANSGGSNVSRLNNNGVFLKAITVGLTPTGVAVDANGKVWVTNYGSHNAMRIDPNGGGDGLGAVDLTVDLGAGASPYNYSDMTGIVALSQTAPQGFWTVTYDGGAPATNWGMVCWNMEPCDVSPPGTDITARVRSSEDQITWSAWVAADNCVDFDVPDGRYLEVEMKLTPNDDGDSPILCDVTICTGIQFVDIDIKPQSCPNPLNVRMVDKENLETDSDIIIAANKLGPGGPQRPNAVIPVAILGTDDLDVTDIDPATIMLAGVAPLRWNYEDVSTPVGPDADSCECHELGPDGQMDLTLKFSKMAVINALGAVTNGDVIPLTLTGQLNDGTSIEGYDCVLIRGPRITKGDSDDDSDIELSNQPNPFNPKTKIVFTLPKAGHTILEIYNILGQKMETLIDEYREVGKHSVMWDGSNAASGVYLYRVSTDNNTAIRRMLLLK